MVDAIVGWEHHERPDGTLDFGESARRLDLALFLRLAHEHGLFVCVRPGPRQFDAKAFARLGLPAAVMTDAQVVLPRAPNSALSLGQPDVAEPSLASTRYLSRAREWLAAAEVEQERIPETDALAKA